MLNDPHQNRTANTNLFIIYNGSQSEMGEMGACDGVGDSVSRILGLLDQMAIMTGITWTLGPWQYIDTVSV